VAFSGSLVAVLALLVASCDGQALGESRNTGGSSPTANGFGSSWTVYHHDGLGTGVDPSGTKLMPLSPAWTSPVLNGEIFGEPLVYQGRVLAATEADTVYELAANTGKVIWSHHLATPVPDSDLPCTDIHPTVGVTGTPVIDPARDEVFLVADQLTGKSGATHVLYGLDLKTGATRLDQVVDPPGSEPLAQLQRPGLALDRGRVLVAFGGNSGDCSYYHGWVVSVAETGGALQTFEIDRAAGDSQGAIWMGGAAPVVDTQGNVWVVTGNGSVHSSSPPWSNYDDSDGVLELSPTLSLLQFFAPTTWPTDNAQDADLGSDQVALVGTQAIIAGKSRTAYLLNRSNLGSIGHQEQEMGICGSVPGGGIAAAGSTAYIPCGHGVEAVQIQVTPPHMKVLWQTSSGSAGPAVIASGLVWTISRAGELYGLSPSTGQAVVSKPIGTVANHFSTPTVADGLLLAPTANRIVAFKGPGGLPPPPSPQAAS
jgi:outer membrane protein assembly factor BamB